MTTSGPIIPAPAKPPLHIQRINFTRDLAELIWWADTMHNIAVVCNEVYRPKEMAALYAERGIGIIDSLHILGLAADLLLYVEGVYIMEPGRYEVLGVKWESLSPENRWGGRFTRPDPDHFERRPE